MLRARARARTVFPTPGTSSIRTWPRASRPINSRSTALAWPRKTFDMFSRSRSIVEWATNYSAERLPKPGCKSRHFSTLTPHLHFLHKAVANSRSARGDQYDAVRRDWPLRHFARLHYHARHESD